MRPTALTSDQLALIIKEGGDHSEVEEKFEAAVNKGHRTLMVLIYCLVMVGTGLLYAPLTPFSKTVQDVYEQPLEKINLTSSLWSFAGLFTGIPANYLITKLGVRGSIVLCTFLFLVGMITRTFINVRFEAVHLGQIIAGLGGPFASYLTAGFAAHWFTGPTRGIILSVTSIMGPLGTMLSFLLPFQFINLDYESVPEVQEETRIYLVFHATYAAFIFLLVLFFFHNNKAIDMLKKSEISDEVKEATGIPIGTQLKNLFSDPCYVCILFAFAMLNSCLNGFAGVLSPIVAVWGYSEEFGAQGAAIGVILGLIGSVIYALFLLSKGGQLTNFMIMHTLGFGLLIGMMSALHSQHKLALLSTISCYSMLTIITLPILVDQVSGRVGKDHLQIATGIMYFLSQAANAFFLVILGKLMGDFTKISTLKVMITVMSVIGVMFTLVVFADCFSSKPFAGNTDGGSVSDASRSSDHLSYDYSSRESTEDSYGI